MPSRIVYSCHVWKDCLLWLRTTQAWWKMPSARGCPATRIVSTQQPKQSKVVQTSGNGNSDTPPIDYITNTKWCKCWCEQWDDSAHSISGTSWSWPRTGCRWLVRVKSMRHNADNLAAIRVTERGQCKSVPLEGQTTLTRTKCGEKPYRTGRYAEDFLKRLISTMITLFSIQ